MKPSDDELLEDYLAGDSEISRAYRQQQAPHIAETVDDAILSAARSSVQQPGSQSSGISLLMRWRTPLAVAATLMLSVSLVMSLYDEYGQDVLHAPTADSPTMDKAAASQRGLTDEQITPEEDIVKPERFEESSGLSSLSDQAPGRDVAESAAEAEVVPSTPQTSPPQPARAESELQRQQRLREIADEVEQLKRTQDTLLKERQALQQSIDAVEARTSELKNTVDAAKQSDPADDSMAKELQGLIKLWQQGEKETALTRLQTYLSEHPSLSDDQLQQQLPDDFWQAYANR